MRRPLIKVMTVFIVSLLLVLTGCTRKDVDKPDPHPNPGSKYSVSGTVSPSTIYVPSSNVAASSDVSIRVNNADGTPVVNGTVIFMQGGFGYFDNMELSVRKTTNSSGIATAKYYIPVGTAIENEVNTSITAVLVTDDRQDSLLSPYQDSIPVKIIPYNVKPTVTISGTVSDSNGEGLEGAVITLTDNGGVALSRTSGSYEIAVVKGWSGDVSCTFGVETLKPSKYSYQNLSQSINNVNFVLAASTVALILSPASVTVPQDGSGLKDGVDGMVYYEVFVRDTNGREGIWYTAKSDSSWIQVTGGALNDTPHHFHFKVTGANNTGAIRNGNIIVTPLSSRNGNPSGTPATLAVTQSATASSYSLTTPTATLTMNEGSFIEVAIGDTNAALDYTISSAVASDTVNFSTAILNASTANGNGRIRITCGALAAGNVTTTITVSATGASPVTITVTANDI